MNQKFVHVTINFLKANKSDVNYPIFWIHSKIMCFWKIFCRSKIIESKIFNRNWAKVIFQQLITCHYLIILFLKLICETIMRSFKNINGFLYSLPKTKTKFSRFGKNPHEFEIHFFLKFLQNIHWNVMPKFWTHMREFRKKNFTCLDLLVRGAEGKEVINY